MFKEKYIIFSQIRTDILSRLGYSFYVIIYYKHTRFENQDLFATLKNIESNGIQSCL